MATRDAIPLSPKMKVHKQYTLVIPLDLQRDRVLLGYKLRGFGQGKYNGFGGKVEADETITAAAIRELHEESGLLVEEPDMIQRGALLLETVADDDSPILEIHVFTTERWHGTENATDEMSPTWFSFSKSLTPTTTANETSSGSIPSSFLSTPPPASATSAVDSGSSNSNASDGAAAHDLSAIPYHKMWEESRVWLPHLLQNSLKPVSGTASPGSSNSDLPPSESKYPAATTTTSSSLSELESPTSKSQPDGNTSANNNKRYFIHHVQFVGGTDKDISAEGEYSAWHKMGNRRLDWVDELPVDEWNRKRTFAKYP